MLTGPPVGFSGTDLNQEASAGSEGLANITCWPLGSAVSSASGRGAPRELFLLAMAHYTCHCPLTALVVAVS